MGKRERISSVDTAWLRMDRPTNLMMIVGVLIFDGAMEFERLRHAIESRLLCYSRFRQKAVQEATGAYWEVDEDFDLDSHVHRLALPGDGGKEELERLVADLASTPLDPSKPLWQFHLVENYDGGAALIARIHHCIGDGIALIGVLLSLTDESPDAPEKNLPRDESDTHDSDNFWQQIFEPMTQTMAAAVRASSNLWVRYVSFLMNPGQALDYARVGMGIATEVAKLALMPSDSDTRFKGKPGVAKRVAWTEPLSLFEVKAVGKALGCSVNDVLLSSVAGALRAYLLEKGDAVEHVEIRAMVPVNLRPEGEQAKLGNRFGLVALVLPIGIANPLERVFEVKRRMEELKGSYQAALTLSILGAVGMAPKIVQQQVLDLLASRATAVMTNVPGPQKALYLAGAKLMQPMFWVPMSGDVGMGVSVLSYNDQVQFGLIADRRLVPDPENVVSRFPPEFEKLLLTVLLESWDELRDPSDVEQSLQQEIEQRASP